MKAACALIAIGIFSGFASTLFIKWFVGAASIRTLFNQIIAHLLEIRLVADEPREILRSQWQVIATNGRLIRALALPALILVVPFWWIFVASDAVFARSPLKPGDSTILTINWKHAQSAEHAQISVHPPDGFTIDTPLLQIPSDAQTCLRLRANQAKRGELNLQVNGRHLTKTVSAAPGYQLLSETRGALNTFLHSPLETPFSDQEVESISIQYRNSEVSGWPWWLWLCLGSFFGGAFAMRFRINSRRSQYAKF